MTPKVVCVGAHILDVLGHPVTDIPPGQGRQTLEQIKVTAAGTAGGTAVDLAKLGADVTSVGPVGDDTAGRLLLNLLSEHGVDIERMALRQGGATPATILPVRPNGERPSLHAPGVMDTLTEDDIDWQLIADADVLHIGGPDVLGNFTNDVLPELMRFAEQHNTATTMDLLKTAVLPEMFDILQPSWRYTRYMLPNDDQILAITESAGVLDAANRIRASGVGTVIVTMGAEPSLLAGKDGTEWLDSFDIPVVDTTGCGDAFTAGFIVGISRGWQTTAAARLGISAAALVAQGLGSDAGIVDLPSTLEFWARRAGQAGGDVPSEWCTVPTV